MVSMNVPLEDRAIIHKKGGIRAALSPTRKIRQQYYAEAYFDGEKQIILT